MENLQNIKLEPVFKNFARISEIPRGSGNEKAISDYLKGFAKELNLEVIQDEALNIIIKKPASKGFEKSPTVIIQGHMDMVCEKNEGTDHDFTKDPIELVVKGDDIYAKGTTLGADNGIAVAYAMTLLEDNTIEHPPLEIVLTTDEETGMSGAMALSKENVKGKILINIDTEEEGYLLVSCAGGIRTKSTIKIEKEDINSKKPFALKVRGLKGGHSGCDIHLERGNSNKLLGRILKDINSKIDMNLISINGGSKDNAIPREGDAILATSMDNKDKMYEIVQDWNTTIKKELSFSDKDVEISIEDIQETFSNVITKESTNTIIDFLYLYPNGVNTMSSSIENLTESSNNLGIVKTKDDEVDFFSAVRSSVPSLKDELTNRIECITKIFDGSFEASASYPGWEYNPNSNIRDICIKVYKEMTGKDAIVYAIHAGVECGLFQEKLGDMDMISFGPNIRDAHTPNEHLSIQSTRNIWNYLKEILKNIK